MINKMLKYNEFLNEKLSDKLSGFNEDDILQQYLNNKITIDKYFSICRENNINVNIDIIKQMLNDNKLTIKKVIDLSTNYNISIFNEQEIKQMFLDKKIKINYYLTICNVFNYKKPTKEEFKKYLLDGIIYIDDYIILYRNYDLDIPNNQEIHDIINKYNPDDMLYYANVYSFNDLIYLSIKNGANIHEKNERPLRTAVKNNNFEIVKFLIKNGADIRIWDDELLNIAIKNDNIEIINYLIDNGCDINQKMLNIALDEKLNEIFKLLYKKINFIDFNTNKFYLMKAIKHNNYDIVKFLLDNNIKIDYNEYKTFKNVSTEIKNLINDYD